MSELIHFISLERVYAMIIIICGILLLILWAVAYINGKMSFTFSNVVISVYG